MKKKLYIYITVLWIVGSCGNKEPIIENYSIDYQEFYLTNADSLAELFYQKEFQAKVDTFYFESDSPPNILSFIEYYSVSTYSVSNIKCMLIGGEDAGIICLFKFNYQDKIWELERKMETTTQKIKEIVVKIKNSDYWLENNLILHPDRLHGDVIRFGYVDDDNDIYTRVDDSPDIRLIDQIIALTKIETENENN